MKVVAEYKNKGKSKSIEFVVDTTGELIYTSIECSVLMKDTKRAIDIQHRIVMKCSFIFHLVLLFSCHGLI